MERPRGSVSKYLQYEVTHNTLLEYNSCQWMHSANNVMCPSLRELISSSGSWWVLKGLRVHSKFIVGLPAPMGQSTNGWPWGLATPDLRRSCLTTSLTTRMTPAHSAPGPQPLTRWSLTKLLSRHLLSGVWAGWGGRGQLASGTQIWCRCTLRQYPSRWR